jgi:hypothetical protein
MERKCMGIGAVRRGMAWTVCGLLLALNMPATASGIEGTWTHTAEFCPDGQTEASSGFRFWAEGFPANMRFDFYWETESTTFGPVEVSANSSGEFAYATSTPGPHRYEVVLSWQASDDGTSLEADCSDGQSSNVISGGTLPYGIFEPSWDCPWASDHRYPPNSGPSPSGPGPAPPPITDLSVDSDSGAAERRGQPLSRRRAQLEIELDDPTEVDFRIRSLGRTPGRDIDRRFSEHLDAGRSAVGLNHATPGARLDGSRYSLTARVSATDCPEATMSERVRFKLR